MPNSDTLVLEDSSTYKVQSPGAISEYIITSFPASGSIIALKSATKSAKTCGLVTVRG